MKAIAEVSTNLMHHSYKTTKSFTHFLHHKPKRKKKHKLLSTPIMRRLLTATRRILRLPRGGKTARVVDENSVNYNHREDEAWHVNPTSVFVTVLRIPLIAVSCLCQAGGDDLEASTYQRPLSADEVNHLMVYDSRPYAIYA